MTFLTIDNNGHITETKNTSTSCCKGWVLYKNMKVGK